MKNLYFLNQLKKIKDAVYPFFKPYIKWINKQYLFLFPYWLKFLQIIFRGKEEIFFLYIRKNKQILYPVLGGFFIALNLFYLMSTLISQKKDLASMDTNSIAINFLNSKEIEDLQTKNRKIPQKPKESESPPPTPEMEPQPEQLEDLKLGNFEQNLSLPKNLFGKKEGQSSYGNSEVTPIVRIEPSYPRKAAITGVEGFVTLQFDITSLGTVTNISILQASPPQIFNQAATRALQKWKYKPKIINDTPVKQKGLKVRLDFKLEKQ